MPTPSSNRDIDIQTASKIAALTQSENDFFVLTGSYSIDALTGADVKHNDIDSNIFTPDMPTSIGRIATLMQARIASMELTRQTDSRLEYLLPHRYGQTQVEMQFVEYGDLEQGDDRLIFTLPHERSHVVTVPTVKASLREANNREHIFLVKSLPFSIGTWALRIAGVALDQKREVRESDIRHFAFLAAMPHGRTETIDAIHHHPQMPDGYSADDVLDMSYEVLARRAEA